MPVPQTIVDSFPQPPGDKRSKAERSPPPPALARPPSPRHPQLPRRRPLPGDCFHSDLKGARPVSSLRWSRPHRPLRPSHLALAARRPALHPSQTILCSRHRVDPRPSSLPVQAELLDAGKCSEFEHDRREAAGDVEELQHQQEPRQHRLVQAPDGRDRSDGREESQPRTDLEQRRLLPLSPRIPSLPRGWHPDTAKAEAMPRSSRCLHLILQLNTIFRYFFCGAHLESNRHPA